MWCRMCSVCWKLEVEKNPCCSAPSKVCCSYKNTEGSGVDVLHLLTCRRVTSLTGDESTPLFSGQACQSPRSYVSESGRLRLDRAHFDFTWLRQFGLLKMDRIHQHITLSSQPCSQRWVHLLKIRVCTNKIIQNRAAANNAYLFVGPHICLWSF